LEEHEEIVQNPIDKQGSGVRKKKEKKNKG
jgi:hypothetical protein